MAAAAASQLLGRSWRRNTLCETFLVEQRRVVKRYWVRPGAHRHPRPWRREHEALRRLEGTGFPESYGFTETFRKGSHEAMLSREYIAGGTLRALDEADLPAAASLLACAHGRGVLLGELRCGDFLRDESGRLRLVGLGRTGACRRAGPLFHVRAGHELQRTIGAMLVRDAVGMRRFRKLYFEAGGFSLWRHVAVLLGCGAAGVTRAARLR